MASRHKPAEGLAAFQQVADLRAVLWWSVERQAIDFGVGQRDAETRADFPQHLHVELFQLVRRHRALADTSHAIALDRLGQDH